MRPRESHCADPSNASGILPSLKCRSYHARGGTNIYTNLIFSCKCFTLRASGPGRRYRRETRVRPRRQARASSDARRKTHEIQPKNRFSDTGVKSRTADMFERRRTGRRRPWKRRQRGSTPGNRCAASCSQSSVCALYTEDDRPPPPAAPPSASRAGSNREDRSCIAFPTSSIPQLEIFVPQVVRNVSDGGTKESAGPEGEAGRQERGPKSLFRRADQPILPPA